MAELNDKFNHFSALNHDYVKVAAGIRANLERLKRLYPALQNQPEAIAIEGAARRLEELPSLHTILKDPGAVHRFDDVANQRLYATLDSYYHYLRPVAEERGVTLKRPGSRYGVSQAQVYASRRVLGGMILQLVDNAITYSPPGAEVSIVLVDPVGSANVEIVVESLGPRIDASERRKIFQPFYRGKAARELRTGGGVGLAVVKVAAQELGGSVSVEQDDTKGDHAGTRFVISLPKN